MDKKDHDQKMIEACDVVLDGIDREGFHYYLCDYTSADAVAKSVELEPELLDPRLRQLWDSYLAAADAIWEYVETAGGRREGPDE